MNDDDLIIFTTITPPNKDTLLDITEVTVRDLLLPILGPSSIVVLDVVHRWLLQDSSVTVRAGDVADRFGLNTSNLGRTLERITRFGFGTVLSARPGRVALLLPRWVHVPRRHLERLPQELLTAAGVVVTDDVQRSPF